MSKTDAQTMVVRLPVEIAEDLIKLRNDKNLSTIGSALKFWIEQQQNEKIEARLNEAENLVTRILNLLFKMNKQTETRSNQIEQRFSRIDKMFRIAAVNQYINSFMLAL
ncbi:unnamed protein product, partial [marine sediment metagenome]